MSGTLSPTEAGSTGARVLSARAIRNGAVWLLFASGFLVFIEPSPFEIAFGLVTLVYVFTGLKISVLFLPLILLLITYNIGGGLSLMGVAEEPRAIWFVAISVYMAVMAIVIAAIFSEDTQRRLALMKSGYALAAVIASIAGILGYFDIAGTFEYFTRNGRAMGTFKDPNVFSTFMVLPIVMIVQGFFLGTHKRPFVAGMILLILAAGEFLSFSRGAWGVTVGSVALCLLLSFLTAPSARLRIRIVLISMIGLVLFITLLMVALQFDEIRATFEVRASLDQDYDKGEMGRFGNQLRSIPLLLDLPNGFGPMFFREFFPEDPHNTFLNAFASYGWLGGISYLGLIVITMVVGWSLVFKRTPWQDDAIAVWSCFFFLIVQGMQIDTDHWRHFYVQLGMTWGLMLASLRYEAWRRVSPMPTAEWSASTAQTVPQS
jgi:hypothetical protein